MNIADVLYVLDLHRVSRTTMLLFLCVESVPWIPRGSRTNIIYWLGLISIRTAKCTKCLINREQLVFDISQVLCI